jgi:HK97 family phage portal protein
MFPEIRARVKGFLARREENSRMVSLELKGAVGLDPFDPGTYVQNGFYRMGAALSGGQSAWSGESVTTATALNHSVVYACNKLISESLGMLPLSMKVSAGAATNEATNKPLYRCLRNAPSDEMTAKTFKETLTSHRLLSGMGYSQILRRSGTGVAVELHPLLPSQVDPDREKEGQKRLVYVVKESGVADKTYTVTPGKPHDLLVLRGLGWDGIKGYSVIQMGRQSIGSAIAAERHVARFWAHGGRSPYLIETAQKFKTDPDYQKWRADWEAVANDPNRAPLMEPGMVYKPTSANMKDSQVLESRLFDIHEICRWFLVSPHLVGDLSRATFSNIEQLALEFVKMTLHTHITTWEQELWRCVLTPEEKNEGYFFKYNVNALLRGDFQTRMAGYSTMLQNGIACVDEVRELEDWNPAPNGAGEGYHIQLNQQTLPPSGATLTSQDAAQVQQGSD